MPAQIGNWDLLRQTEQWGLVLSESQKDAFRCYLEHLYISNERLNLTRVPPERAVGRHLLDSLCLLAVFTPPTEARVLDVGSGAGLPGIPLAIARPDLRLTLLDSHGKTAQFLRETCALLCIPATVVQGRAEEWARAPEAREQFDLVTARAVASMPLLTELMTPFLKVGGVGLALKSARETEEIEQSTPAAQVLGAALTIRTVGFETEQGYIQRAIALLNKEHPTPSRYPRTWAQMLKRPLGGKA